MSMSAFERRTHSGSSRLGRRGFLGASALAALAACSGGESSPPSGTRATPTTSPTVRSDGPIRWANWPGYIDKAKGKRPTLDAFVAQSGISVEYDEAIDDNVTFLASIEEELEAGTSVGYDIITPTSWAAARLVNEGQVQPFGPLESASRVISSLAAPGWDPEQRYAMPWQSGLTGIAYDSRKVDRAIGSILELFFRDDLAGGVGLMTEWNDTLGFVLLSQGRDMTDLSEDMIREAVDFLKERDAAGQIKGYYGNGFIKALDEGEVVATMAWSGDVIQAQFSNPYIKFVVPEEGLMIWSDNLMVPRGSEQAGAVAKLVDYYYQPEVAAELAAYVNYICPVMGAQEAMTKIAPELTENPLIFPDASILDSSYLFPSVPDELFDYYQAELGTLV